MSEVSRAGGSFGGSAAEEETGAGSAAHVAAQADEQASEAKPTDATATPLLRIVTPDATPEEIAALVSVLAALGGPGVEAAVPARPEWNAPPRLVRTPHHPGPDGWRASGLPR